MHLTVPVSSNFCPISRVIIFVSARYLADGNDQAPSESVLSSSLLSLGCLGGGTTISFVSSESAFSVRLFKEDDDGAGGGFCC